MKNQIFTVHHRLARVCNVCLYPLLFTTLTLRAQQPPLFPEVSGWNLTPGTIVYTPGNLWDLINGAADAYLSYDFEDLHLAGYTRDGLMIHAEIYRHSSKNNAFGIYSSERMPDYRFIDIGVQGYIEPGIMNFLTGRHYVKIMTPGTVNADSASLMAIARAIDSHLGGYGSRPETLDLFPEDNRIIHSESFINESFIGYGFFRDAFIAGYNDGSQYRLFIMKMDSNDEAQSVTDKYFKLAKKTEALDENIYRVTDPFNGTVYLGICSNYLIGALNLTDNTKALNQLHKIANLID